MMSDPRQDPTGRWRPRAWLPLMLFAVVSLAVASCADDGRDAAAIGDIAAGEQHFIEYGCAACHQVSGIRQAVGRVGPNLDDYAEQRIIAGVLPNTPGHLAAWLQEPSAYAPNTGMPDVGVTDEHVMDLVAFLLDR